MSLYPLGRPMQKSEERTMAVQSLSALAYICIDTIKVLFPHIIPLSQRFFKASLNIHDKRNVYASHRNRTCKKSAVCRMGKPFCVWLLNESTGILCLPQRILVSCRTNPCLHSHHNLDKQGDTWFVCLGEQGLGCLGKLQKEMQCLPHPGVCACTDACDSPTQDTWPLSSWNKCYKIPLCHLLRKTTSLPHFRSCVNVNVLATVSPFLFVYLFRLFKHKSILKNTFQFRAARKRTPATFHLPKTNTSPKSSCWCYIACCIHGSETQNSKFTPVA